MEKNFITEDMKLAVKNGAYFMDTEYPGWAHRIDLNNLQMENCKKCIIGQAVETNYWEIVDVNGGYSRSWAEEHGFDIYDDDIEYADELGLTREARDRYLALETLWTDEVHKRLG